jgi:hypothetical protein
MEGSNCRVETLKRHRLIWQGISSQIGSSVRRYRDGNVLVAGHEFAAASSSVPQLHLHFSVFGNGLLLKFGSQVTVNELAIAGSDRNFRWATSSIASNSIMALYLNANHRNTAHATPASGGALRLYGRLAFDCFAPF